MKKESKIRLQAAYHGAAYSGWQKQPSGNAVQNHLEEALQRLFNCDIRTVGSSRTDRGVHALDQNVHFALPEPALAKLEGLDLVYRLNRLLPEDIVIKKAWNVDPDFHALGSAESKVYRYRILCAETPCPLRHSFTWYQRNPPSLEKLQALSQLLVGTHDFQSFQTAGTEVPTTVKTVIGADWKVQGDEWVFTIQGEGFLKQMVRNIVGSLIELQALPLEGEPLLQEFRQKIASKDRRQMPAPAPGAGLILEKVHYPPAVLRSHREISRRER